MPLGLDPRVWNALLLTSLGAAGTGLGGLMVVVQPKFSFKKLGYLQGCAAGLMLALSFFDLLPESTEAVGEATANLWFFIGIAFFAVIVAVIPEPDSSNLKLDVGEDETEGAAATGRGGAENGKDEITDAGAAGTPPAITTAARRSSRLAAQKDAAPSAGSGAVKADKSGAPAPSKAAAREARRKVLLSGLITALGIALHNFPEGVAVFLASIKSSSIGLSLAIAIALHNIPEGVAVALPVYFATGSRLRGFMYALVSGLAEPLAVIVLGVVFRAFWLDKMVIDCLLAAVGGIMAFLSLHELLPLSIEHAGQQRAVLSLFVGMAIMVANLHILDKWMEGGHAH